MQYALATFAVMIVAIAVGMPLGYLGLYLTQSTGMVEVQLIGFWGGWSGSTTVMILLARRFLLDRFGACPSCGTMVFGGGKCASCRGA